MSYANPQYLVETDWLEQHLHDAELRIFDVTGMLTSKLENIAKEECYDNGHIPRAAFLDVASAKGVLSEPNAKLPWTWPSQEQFEALMGRIGVTSGCAFGKEGDHILWWCHCGNGRRVCPCAFGLYQCRCIRR